MPSDIIRAVLVLALLFIELTFILFHPVKQPFIETKEKSHKPHGKTSLFSGACRPFFLANGRKIDRIYFQHMRKAGGTTIRHYLLRVAKAYNLKLEVREGDLAEDPLPNSTTFYVTNLREPMARILSSYKFEGRWACERNGSYYRIISAEKPPVPATQNNSLTFEQFIEKDHLHGTWSKNKKRPGLVESLWYCARNCYTRWLSNVTRVDDIMENYDIARTKISKYNLIIITEKLTDPQYVASIEKMFNVSGLKKHVVYCAEAIEEFNKKFPPIISNKTWNDLVTKNSVDSALYEEFTSCTNGFDFPVFNETKFQIN